MNTPLKLAITTSSLVGLGAACAYAATSMAMQGHATASGANILALALVAALTVLVLVVFWRQLHQAADAVTKQLENMAQTGQIGLVMSAGADPLTQVVKPLNRFLTATRGQIEQLRNENRELQIQNRIADAEKQHVEAIIFSISDAVIVTNRFDELMLANEEAERLLGFKTHGAIRKNIDQVLSDGVLVRLVRETRAQGRKMTRKVVEHTLDSAGEPRTYNVTLSCVMTGNDEVAGVVAVMHDVTKEKEIARMKTDFVSNVSHELRTPLASIKAYVEMLIDGEADDDQTRQEFYEIIFGESERLGRLIDNILNISRIESGLVKVVKEPLNLSAVVTEALEVARPQAKGKSIELIENIAPVFGQVEADRDMIYQAVLNLVGNAIKYTAEGGTVTVTTSQDERRGVAVCDVSDTGVGIPSDDLPHVFDKFYRVQSSSKMAKGTGLGLSLVKHIIETVHEGKLGVTSEDGKGSTFSFELPLVSEAG